MTARRGAEMNEELRRLLTASVDGELTPAEEIALSRLLETSPEAREELRRLQRDAEGLRGLPRRTLPNDFAFGVLQEIRRRRLRPSSLKTPRRPAWLRFAAGLAAAVIIVANGLGTYFLVRDMVGVRPAVPAPLAARQPAPPVGPPENLAGPLAGGPQHSVLRPGALAELRRAAPADETLRDYAAKGRAAFEPLARGLQGLARSGSEQVARLESFGNDPGAAVAREAPFNDSLILTSPVRATSPFKTFDLKLPQLFFDLRDFDSVRLQGHLQDGSLHHVDLSCLEAPKAFERLQAACRSVGLRLVVEPDLTQRFAKRVPTMPMLYLENVERDKAAKLLETLRKLDGRESDSAQFGSVMVQVLDDDARKKLAEVLSVPAGLLGPAKLSSKTPAGSVDPAKPLAEETVKALERTAAGQGSKSSQATGYAFAYLGVRKGFPASPSLKQALEARSGWQGELVHFVFVLRPGKGT